jgi:DNA-binding MarR family transcriptional regulator
LRLRNKLAGYAAVMSSRRPGESGEPGRAALATGEVEVDLTPLVRASQVVTAAIVRSLAEVDSSLSVPQLRVLVMVANHGPLSMGAVAEALGVNASNASRTCDRLVDAGLLDRSPAEDDRRRVALTLTDRGAALVEQVMERRRADLARVVARMAPADQRALVRALEPLNDAANAADTDAAGVEHLIAWYA